MSHRSKILIPSFIWSLIWSLRIRSPKLGVLGALLAPFSPDRWRTDRNSWAPASFTCSSWPWTYPTNIIGLKMRYRKSMKPCCKKKSNKWWLTKWRNLCQPWSFGDRVRNVWAQGEEAWSIVKPLIVRLCCFMIFHDCSMRIYGFYCEEWWKPGRTEFDASIRFFVHQYLGSSLGAAVSPTLQSAEMVSFKAESMLVQSEQKGPLSSGLKKSMTAEQPTSIKIRWKVKELQGTRIKLWHTCAWRDLW